MHRSDVLVIGAGLAGLSCARSLTDAGLNVRVLERSTQVGGRCASKAPGVGHPAVDFGPVFVHGDDEEFTAWLEESGLKLVPGWPLRVRGAGTPCQPQAFDPLQKRWALPSGLRGLAESLSTGLDLVLGAQVEILAADQGGWVVTCADGRSFSSTDLVLALATEQSRDLLLPTHPGIAALLGTFASLPCLAVLAAYPRGVPSLDWDLWYPEDSASLLLVSNEASKGGLDPSVGKGLVIQARPRWSRERMNGDRDLWGRELLTDAAALVGDWVLAPEVFRTHRWKYGRLGPADHLASPLLLSTPGQSRRLGLAGDLFDADGGLQGAWRSGRRLALKLLGTGS